MNCFQTREPILNFKEMCKLLGIEKTRTSPYRPQSDGMVERTYQTIENMLSMFVEPLSEKLGYLSHASSGVSPCLMMLGREISLPIDLCFERLPDEEQREFNSDYLYDFKDHGMDRFQLHIGLMMCCSRQDQSQKLFILTDLNRTCTCTLGLEICQGVPNAYFGLTEWADQRMKNVN